MITLFTIPKPFHGHFGLIQDNAIRSWLALGQSVRVVLLGDEPGTAEYARSVGATHLPEIVRNQYGTPLLNNLFTQAEAHSDGRLLCFINADIVVMSDFMAAIQRVARRKKRFLMVGQRWDLDFAQRLEMDPGWEIRLRDLAHQKGKQHRPTGVDYFVYNRGMWGTLPGALPPFAIGRYSWDNWMIYRARSLLVPVIDAGGVVTAVHQNHDYSHAAHVFGGRHFSPEAKDNLALAGGNTHLFTIWDSTHVLIETGLTQRQATGLGGGIWSYRRSAASG